VLDRADANLLQVLQGIEYEEALQAGDPRYVDTREARGSEQTFKRLARKFGWDPGSDQFFPPHDKHILFFGHIGCGKTTELRHYASRLNASQRFYVVEVDVLAKLDRNNLQYTEVLMAMAESLLERLQADGSPLAVADLQPMRDWFSSTSVSHSFSSELSAQLNTGLDAAGGIPGLVKLLASFTAAIKTGSSRKTEWRQEIRNRFTSLASAFNALIQRAELELARASGRGTRVLFLVDGTDKMRSEDTQQFFVQDAEQLLAINSLVIYTAPLHLKYDGRLGGKLDAYIVLPMIKLEEQDGRPFPPGLAAMRELLLKRAPRSLFAGEAELDRLVVASGGHPRELLRLLKLCCELADDSIDATVVGRAIAKLAGEYRYFLQPEDYQLLKSIDTTAINDGTDQREQELLQRLALLQYNDGSWRRSHPVVRTLEGYQRASGEAGRPRAAAPAA
jgi:hypothetical protein